MSIWDNLYLSFNVPIGIAFDILMIIFMWSSGFYSWKRANRFKSNNFHITILCLFLFCVFTFVGDWQHYSVFITETPFHLEEIYQWMLEVIKPGYIMFRVIVWGLTIYCTTLMANLLKINKQLFFLFLTTYCLVFFPNGRVTLAIAVQFLGLAFIVRYNLKKGFLTILGIGLIIMSFFLHRSAIFGIGIIGIALILGKLNKLTITLAIISLPLFILAVSTILKYIQIGGMNSSTMIEAEHLSQNYLQSGYSMSSFGLTIFNSLQFFANILCGLLIIKSIYNQQYKKWPYQFRIYANVTILGIFISSLFFFDFGTTTGELRYRLAQFAFIPAVVTLTYCRQRMIYYSLVSKIFFISMFMTMFRYLYFFYCALV